MEDLWVTVQDDAILGIREDVIPDLMIQAFAASKQPPVKLGQYAFQSPSSAIGWTASNEVGYIVSTVFGHHLQKPLGSFRCCTVALSRIPPRDDLK